MRNKDFKKTLYDAQIIWKRVGKCQNVTKNKKPVQKINAYYR